MFTIVETPTFAADAKDLWTEEERGAFCAWLSAHPEIGDVIPAVVVAVKCAGAGRAKARVGVSALFTSLDSPMVNYGYWSYMQRVFAETSRLTY